MRVGLQVPDVWLFLVRIFVLRSRNTWTAIQFRPKYGPQTISVSCFKIHQLTPTLRVCVNNQSESKPIVGSLSSNSTNPVIAAQHQQSELLLQSRYILIAFLKGCCQFLNVKTDSVLLRSKASVDSSTSSQPASAPTGP